MWESDCKGLQKDVSIWFCEENDTALKLLVKHFLCCLRGPAPVSLWLDQRLAESQFLLKIINCRKAILVSVTQPQLHLPQKPLPGSWEMALLLTKDWFDYRKNQEPAFPMALESWGMCFSHKSPCGRSLSLSTSDVLFPSSLVLCQDHVAPCWEHTFPEPHWGTFPSFHTWMSCLSLPPEAENWKEVMDINQHVPVFLHATSLLRKF